MSRYFSGQGKVYAAMRASDGTPGRFVYLGNCAALQLTPGIGMDQFADRADAGGLVQPFAESGGMPSLTLPLDDLQRENVAWAVRGRPTVVAGGSSTETITARLGAFVPVSQFNLTDVGFVKSADGVTTYAAGTDYVSDLPGGGIVPIAGAAIAEAQQLLVNYTFADHEAVGGFTDAAPFFRLRVNGINTVDKKPFASDFYKCRLGVAETLPLIGDDFVTLSVSVRLFYDRDQPDDPIGGRLFRIRFA